MIEEEKVQLIAWIKVTSKKKKTDRPARAVKTKEERETERERD